MPIPCIVHLQTLSPRVMFFAPEPSNPNETAVAFTQVGEGWLGYVGDVNNEKGSQAVVFSMLELAAEQSASK